jgi:hypothetical protein
MGLSYFTADFNVLQKLGQGTNAKYKNPYLNSCVHINVDVLLFLPQLQA